LPVDALSIWFPIACGALGARRGRNLQLVAANRRTAQR
jgi:hypothetical protein